MVQAITVVYDDHCELCRRCRAWLEQSDQLVPIGFVAASDDVAIAELGVAAIELPVGDELIVVGATAAGEARPIWIGSDAFITCLWALRDHRRLSGRLQQPAMRPLAKAAFHALSSGRGSISSVLGAFDPGLACDTNCSPNLRPG